MDKNLKRSIDILTPTAVAGIIAFYLFKAGKKPQYLLIAAVLSFAIIYIITTQITKAIREAGLKPDKVNVTPDQAGNLEKNFDAATWAKDFYNDTNCLWCMRKTSLYSDALRLSNASLQLIYNWWLDNYYDNHNETWVEAMDAENFGVGLFNSAAADGPNLIARLKQLGMR